MGGAKCSHSYINGCGYTVTPISILATGRDMEDYIHVIIVSAVYGIVLVRSDFK